MDEDLKGQVENRVQERQDLWEVWAASLADALRICREGGAEGSWTFLLSVDPKIGPPDHKQEDACVVKVSGTRCPVPEESASEEIDSESEVFVSEVFLAAWRAKQKTAGIRKGRVFQANPQYLRDHVETVLTGDLYRDLREDPRNQNTKCAANGKIGHWRGDAAYEKNNNTESRRSDNYGKAMSQIFFSGQVPCQWMCLVQKRKTSERRYSRMKHPVEQDHVRSCGGSCSHHKVRTFVSARVGHGWKVEPAVPGDTVCNLKINSNCEH